MPSVKCRYREYVHEGENDAEECRHEPEEMPVPYWWEEASDSSESSERLGPVGSEKVFQVAYISAEYLHAVADACRETLKEPVADGRGLVVGVNGGLSYAELELGSKEKREVCRIVFD